MRKLSILFGLLAAFAVGALADTDCTTTITGGTINDNLNVPDGATCTLDGVTVNGNANVGKGSTLNATDGFSISGNLQGQNAASINVQGGNVSGNVQSQGPANVNFSAMVIGHDVQIQNALSFCTQHGPPGPAIFTNIGGNLQIQGTTNTPPAGIVCGSTGPPPGDGSTAAANLICGTTVGGDAQIQQNTAPFAIGSFGSSYCGGSPVTIKGNLQVQQNGTVTIDITSVGHNLECSQNGSVSQLNGAGDDTVQGKNKCPGIN